MRRLSSCVIAALLVIGAGGVRAQSSVEADVKAAYDSWNAAFNNADAAQVAAHYTDNAKLLPPTHDVMEGPAGVETFFSGLLSNGVTGHTLELIEATGGPDTIVGAARWAAQGKDANGAAASFGGITVHVFERQADGSLKLKMHTFN